MPIRQRADWEYTERQKLLMKGGGKKAVIVRNNETAMNDEELNKWIHKNVMDLPCYHSEDRSTYIRDVRGFPIPPPPEHRICKYCGATDVSFDILGPMKYCTDLNAAVRAEVRVIEKIGRSAYGHKLAKQIGGELYHIEPTTEFFTDIATASARTRCEAMKLAMEDQK